MLEVEEKLFDEFKRTDSICRDMFWSQSGIGQYITEMEQNSFHGRYVVPSWDRDYQMLKRTRWLRNQIAHDSSATDCSEEDAKWLEEFHSRLLAQEDPLALLEKAKQERLRAQAQRVNQPKIDPKRDENRDIPFFFPNEIDPAELSARSQRENKLKAEQERNEDRVPPLQKKNNTSSKIVLMIFIGLMLLIGLAVAVGFLYSY